MQANLRTCNRLLLIAILSCALISVSAHASTISFFIDKKGAVKLDLSKTKNLDLSTWAVKLGKNADGGCGQFKLTGKEIKAKGNTSWTNIIGSSGDWTELFGACAEYFDANVSVNNAKFENSTPVHNPIPATVWIFGTGLVTLIMIRRKFHSPIS